MTADLLDVTEVARLLGRHPNSVHRLVIRGELTAYGVPRRFKRQDVLAYIERCRVKPGDMAHLYPPPTKGPANVT